MQEEKVKSKLIRSLLESNIIDAEDIDVYEYGLGIFKLYFITFLALFLWSYICNILAETIIFIMHFLLIRVYSGGLHLKNELSCLITSVIVFGSVPIFIKKIDFICIEFQIFIFIVMLIAISLLCPIKSKHKNMDEFQCSLFKKKAQTIIIFMLCEVFVFTILGKFSICYIIVGSLFLNLLNILLGYYLN